jgi:phage baseplate assembly protein W
MATSPSNKVTNIFSDFDMDFVPHPQSGDIRLLKDSDSVKRSVRNILFTGKYERPFNPNFGGNLKQLLFEPATPLTAVSIREYIEEALRIYEPRVSIVQLQVNLDQDMLGYNVYLLFAIDNTSQIEVIDVFLERIR